MEKLFKSLVYGFTHYAKWDSPSASKSVSTSMSTSVFKSPSSSIRLVKNKYE